MAVSPGRKRVIINNVLPTVDGGLYPAKAVVNSPVILSADIFTDGIDNISACVSIKPASGKQWKEYPLSPAGNDRWTTSFIPEEMGAYYFQVSAWINNYASWREGIKKKFIGEVDISVDLKNGVRIAGEAVSRVTGKPKEVLAKWMKELESVDDQAHGLALAEDNNIDLILYKFRDKSKVTSCPQTFEIWVEPVKAVYSTWYELFPRSASVEAGKHGTFSDVAGLLPRIARAGFDVLYLPPIHPIGVKNRKGRNNSLAASAADPGSPWAIGNSSGGHKAIHPELGNLRDFKRLVKEAKGHGIDMAMDVAFQCAPDHPYVKQHPEWFKWRADGTVQFAENPPKKYEDILPFDFDSEDIEGLWKELKSIIKYWADNGIRIFRVDNPHTKAIPFWEWAIRELKSEYPEMIFLAEAFTRPRVMEHLAKTGFTQSYTYFAWRNKRNELTEYMTELTKTERQHYFRPNLWPNTPDILTDELIAGGENAHIMRLILAATLSASYGVYGPAYEFGINEQMPGKEEYNHNEKYEIKHWDWDRYTKIWEVMTRVNRIRRENVALHVTNNLEFAETDNEQIICYMKADASRTNVMIMVVNLDPFHTQNAYVKLPLYKVGLSYDEPFLVHDLLSGDRYEWGENNFVSLNPYDMPAHILKLVRR